MFSMSCGLVVVPPLSLNPLSSELNSHFDKYITCALHPYKVIPTFFAKQNGPSSSDSHSAAGETPFEDGLWLHMKDVISRANDRIQANGMRANDDILFVMVCHSVMSPRAFALQFGNGHAFSTDIITSANDELQVMQSFVQSISSASHASASLILASHSGGADNDDGMRCLREAFPELLLDTPHQSVVCLKRRILNTDEEWSQSVDVDNESGGLLGPVVDGCVYNLSSYAANRDCDLIKFHLSMRQMQLRNGETLGYERLTARSLTRDTFTSSPTRLGIVTLARSVALAAHMLQQEIRLVAAAWREMKTYEHDTKPSSHLLLATMMKGEGGGKSAAGGSASGLSDTVTASKRSDRRIMLGSRLHVANVEILLDIVQGQQAVDKGMAMLWIVLAFV
jgi:hypothetical protein